MIPIKKIIIVIERYLVRIIIFCVLVIVITQGIMTNDPLRLYLSWSERMEGQVVEYPQVNAVNSNSQDNDYDVLKAASPEAGIVISIEDFTFLPEARILVNGREEARFNKKEVSLLLKAGDEVQIDSSAYKFPIKYRLKNCSSNLAFPKKDTQYTVNRDIVIIGKIIVK